MVDKSELFLTLIVVGCLGSCLMLFVDPRHVSQKGSAKFNAM